MDLNPKFKNLFDTLTRSAYLEGQATLVALNAIDADLRKEIDTKFAALAGEDAKINAVLSMLQKITDAEPGSEEWDEGQNLYELISSKYVGLAEQVEANTVAITDLQNLAQGMAQDLATYNQNMTALVNKEIADRKAAITEVKELISANKTAMEATNAANTEKFATLTAKNDSLQEQLTARTQELGALTIKHDDLVERVETLEGYFVSLGDGTEIANEFVRGLQGQPSAYGHGTNA